MNRARDVAGRIGCNSMNESRGLGLFLNLGYTYLSPELEQELTNRLATQIADEIIVTLPVWTCTSCGWTGDQVDDEPCLNCGGTDWG
jgi:hypothetical protein